MNPIKLLCNLIFTSFIFEILKDFLCWYYFIHFIGVNINEQKHTWDLSEPVKIMLLCGADLLESFSVPNLWSDSDVSIIFHIFSYLKLFFFFPLTYLSSFLTSDLIKGL